MNHSSNILMMIGILLLAGSYMTANAALGRGGDAWDFGLIVPLLLFVFGSRLVLGWEKPSK